MLKEKVVAEVLKQVQSNGVQNVFLLDKEGLLLAKSTNGTDTKKFADSNVSAALISYTWDTFERHEIFYELRDMVLEFEGGTFLVKKIASMLLVLEASADAPLGAVQEKMKTLADYLLTPLSIVSKLQSQSESMD